MNTTEPLTEEAALWASINEMPGDQLRRLVLADWYEERSGKVKCGQCKIISGKAVCPDCVHWRGRVPKDCRCRGTRRVDCPSCSGTGYVPNGFADMAAALRATADRVPYHFYGRRVWAWTPRVVGMTHNEFSVNFSVWDGLTCGLRDEASPRVWRDYHTAAEAIMDMCRAWVKVHREGTA